MTKNLLVVYSGNHPKYEGFARGYASLIESQVADRGEVHVSTKKVTDLTPQDLASHVAIVTALPSADRIKKLGADGKPLNDLTHYTQDDYTNAPEVEGLFTLIRDNAANGVPYIRVVSGIRVNVPQDMRAWVDGNTSRVAGVSTEHFRALEHQGLTAKSLQGVHELLDAIGVEHKPSPTVSNANAVAKPARTTIQL